MDRRNFFKIIGVTSAGAITEACGPDTDALIPMLVPEDQIVPGVEQWHPAVCGECAAGCGTIVRLMEGRRVIEAAVIPVESEDAAGGDVPAEVVADPAGQKERVRQRLAAVKKIEGNPLDPISRGHLCARGQAVVQSLYNPDRLEGPQQLAGERGSGEFTATTWDEALAAAAERIRAVAPENVVVMTGAQAGTRSAAWARFTEALGAPPPVVCGLDGHAVEREAARRVFGWDGLPIYDIAEATSVLNVGADFLGGWISPVYYARKYGEFRQGRSEIRGTLVSAESRLSTTAAAADRWLPVRPGTEAQFAGAVGAMLLEIGVPNREAVPEEVIAQFAAVNIAETLEACGLSVGRVREVVERWAGSLKPLMIGGASVTQSNSVDAVAATHYINLMLGNVGQAGGLLAPGAAVTGPAGDHRVREALQRGQVILIDNADPVYTLPLSAGVEEVLGGARAVISLASFLDDSAAHADLILPAHHYLEAETALAPSLSMGPSLAINTPFIRPLYDTRPVEQTIADLAGALGLTYENPTAQQLAASLVSEALPYSEIARQGGEWREDPAAEEFDVITSSLELGAADADGDAGQYALQFQPYLSIKYHDGRGANLPWMQELPDPVSSTMWELPVEIDPRTAEQMGIRDGDRVQVESAHGTIAAPAYVHPGAIPGVVSMAIGDGHKHYGRYAAGRGANPLSILAPMFEASTGALVMGGTRVRLSRMGGGMLTQYSFQSNEHRNVER